VSGAGARSQDKGLGERLGERLRRRSSGKSSLSQQAKITGSLTVVLAICCSRTALRPGMDSRASTFDDYRKQLQMVLEDPSEAPVPVSLDFLKDITDGFSSDRLNHHK